MGVEIRIREFRKGDMDALYFLDQRCHAPGRRASYARMLDTLLDRNVAALVAEKQAETQPELIGALVVQGDATDGRLHIVTLMVDAGWRRVGIGRRLLTWAGRLGEGFKCTTLHVPLEEGNAEGRAFLSAEGFTESEENDPLFESPEDGRIWTRPLNLPAEGRPGKRDATAGAATPGEPAPADADKPEGAAGE